MDPSPSGGGRRKKRGGRSGGGRSNNNNNSGGGGNKNRRPRKRGHGGNPMSRASLDRLPPTATRDDSSVLGGRLPPTGETQNHFDGDPDGFGLFCAYYLGVTSDDSYQKPSLDETARRYKLSHDEVRSLLRDHKLDPETFKGSSFDLEGAKLDVRLAPEGISRIEIARDHYAEYVSIIEE